MIPAPDVLTRRVRATPDRTAIVDAATGDAASFESLDAEVRDRGGRLLGLGLDSGERLGLLVDTSVATVELVHAALRIGVRIVPLNVRNTPADVERQLRTADVDAVLSDPAHLELARSATRALSLDAVSTDRVEAASSGPAPRQPEPYTWDLGETMVIVFTSGTTGDPKAVPLTRSNLEWSAIASAFRLGTVSGDRWLCCLPVYHVGGLAPFVRTALYGTTAVVLETADPDAIATATHDHEVTGVSLVPTLLHRIFESEATLADSLRCVLVGGAPTSDDLLERCEARGVPIHPTYGLTETASQVATARPPDAFENPGTVGKPLVGTEVRIVDGEGTELPAGEVGEIVVSGPTVTPGYVDGSGSGPGEDGLRTGDLGYLDTAGRLWVTGRAADVILTGGETVHADAVESTLTAHPAVKEAAVVGLPDPEWGERVAAVVVTDAEPDAIDLDSFCADRLAGYERPREILAVDELPRTASGTVDREAARTLLRDPE